MINLPAADFGYGAQLGGGVADSRASVVGTTYWMVRLRELPFCLLINLLSSGTIRLLK